MENITYHKNSNGVGLYTDSTEFYIKIISLHGDNFLTVGHSSPNYSDINDEYISNKDEMISEMKESFDEMELTSMEEMMPIMYNKLKDINSIFNKYLG